MPEQIKTQALTPTEFKDAYDFGVKYVYTQTGNKEIDARTSSKVQEVANKLGLTLEDLNNGKIAKSVLERDPENVGAINVQADNFSKAMNRVGNVDISWWQGGGFSPTETKIGDIGEAIKGNWRRFVVQNFAADNPEAQVRYFRDRDFDTKIENGQVFIRNPKKDIGWKPIKPEGLDPFSVLDNAYKIASGALEGLAASAKLGGVALIPETGGLSVPASMLFSGFVGGLTEAGRQVGQKALTGQPYDPSLVAKETVAGSLLPGLAQPIGSGLRLVGRKSAEAYNKISNKLVSDYKEVKAAMDALGAKIIPAMVTSDVGTKLTTEAIYKSPGSFGVKGIKQSIEDLKDTVKLWVSNMVEKGSTQSKEEAGVSVKNIVEEIIQKKLDAGAELYNQAIKASKADEVVPYNREELESFYGELKNAWNANRHVTKTLNKYEESLGNVDSYEKLNQFRKSLASEIRKQRGKITGEEILALTQFGDAVTNSLNKHLTNAIEIAQKKGDYATAEIINHAIVMRSEGDKLWSEAFKDLSILLNKNQPDLKGGANIILSQFLETMPPEKISSAVFGRGASGIKAFAERFPEAFETLRLQKLGNLREQWKTGNDIDQSKATQYLKNLLNEKTKSKEELELIFGEGAEEKAKILVKAWDAIPKGLINPSGTLVNSGWFNRKMFFENLQQFRRSLALSFSQSAGMFDQGTLAKLADILETKKLLVPAGIIQKQITPSLLPDEKYKNKSVQFLPNIQQQ